MLEEACLGERKRMFSFEQVEFDAPLRHPVGDL